LLAALRPLGRCGMHTSPGLGPVRRTHCHMGDRTGWVAMPPAGTRRLAPS
jgi:hypothetical protein